MKIRLKPKTKLGKISIMLVAAFFVLLGIFFMLVSMGERGGNTYFSNLKLTIPFTIAWLSAIGSFFSGIISIIKNKERSVFVFLSSLIGFLVLLFILAEFLFPH